MPSFAGLRVLALESRRATEIATLISTYGGQPTVAPAMRELPLDSNPAALAFVDALVRGEIGLVVLLTGVGTRALLAVVDEGRDRAAFVAALARTRIAARGPKPVGVLRELGLTPWVTAAEPNTWRELLAALDARAQECPLEGLTVAVQEYGAPNPDLLHGLEARGARVMRVPVYRWALPEEVGPLREAARGIAAGRFDVVILTTATQVVHLFQLAAELGIADAVQAGFGSMIAASIGPTTSQGLRDQGLNVDLEASHPKMGFLVREAAERAAELLAAKRARGIG